MSGMMLSQIAGIGPIRHPGYTLKRVDMSLKSTRTPPPVYSGSLWKGNQFQITLVNPTTSLSSSFSTQSFTATNPLLSGITLESDRDYWLIFDITPADPSDDDNKEDKKTDLRLTSSNAEDADSATGWSIDAVGSNPWSYYATR